jgi:demethylmenaquinone methyltransferase/2-methoxy-6-polyprenyl-1,4-benzoquinol methylase
MPARMRATTENNLMSIHHQTEPAQGTSSVAPAREQTRELYDRIAPFYDLLSERTEWPVRHQALAALNARIGEQMLEIGCGTGLNLAALARAVGPHGHVHGLDLSKAMLDRARGLLRRSSLEKRVTLRWGDATDLPYLNGIMHGVLMTFTLELFEAREIPMVLAESRRVLRPGGRIVVASLTKDIEADVSVHLLEWLHAHVPQVLDCRPIHVRQELAQAGFTIAEDIAVHAWVPVEIVVGTVDPASSGPNGSSADRP